MRYFILITFLLLAVQALMAQQVKPIKEVIPTDNLEVKKDANKRGNMPKRKKIGLIYVPNAHKIAYGNVCVTQETHKMGFEYIVEPRGAGSRSGMGKFLNNLAVKTKLVFTRSPFWKQILNGKIKKCRQMSGDLVG